MKSKNKGFLKDPLIYLGVSSFIFLFGIIIFSSKLNIKSPSLWDFSFFSSETLAESTQKLFAEPVKNILKDSPEMTILQQNSIVGVAPPVVIISKTLGVLTEDDLTQYSEPDDKKSIIEYTVEEGDTLSSIAAKFDISLNTILWANDLTKTSKVKLGQKLVILPVSGVFYNVQKGDTISDIAKKYKGKVDEIITFNNLSGEGDIFVGDIIIIPNGVMPAPTSKYTQPSTPQIPIASSYFICPTSSCKISQGLHWYNAIDFSEPCGNPVFAAAAGTVLRTSWDKVGGNYITVLHPNGVVTYYGHLSSFLVKPGDNISQGSIVGLIGRTGVTTGCHIHFDVRGSKNPFAK